MNNVCNQEVQMAKMKGKCRMQRHFIGRGASCRDGKLCPNNFEQGEERRLVFLMRDNFIGIVPVVQAKYLLGKKAVWYVVFLCA